MTPVDNGLPSLVGVKVLVVEDDEATGYVLSRQLERAGAVVQTVDGAEGALPILHSERIDVLVVTSSCPASTASNCWRGFQRVPRVTIAVTAFDDHGLRERARLAGFNAYLPKPVEPEILVHEIARRVGSQR